MTGFSYEWHMKGLMKATLAMLEMDRKAAEKAAKTEPRKPKETHK
jgi:hypothetical protein